MTIIAAKALRRSNASLSILMIAMHSLIQVFVNMGVQKPQSNPTEYRINVCVDHQALSEVEQNFL